MKYKIISIDMFQTLVCITQRKEIIWKRILKDDYNDERLEKYSRLLSTEVVSHFHDNSSLSSEFFTLKEIFQRGFEKIFTKMEAPYDSHEAAKIFIEEHNQSDWYSDSLNFLNRIGEKYKICLTSDADCDMVSKKIKEFNFDHVIISEHVKSYKKNMNGKVFHEILNHYKVAPLEVLHIGDSSSDIVGAMRLGIDCCFINRHNLPKNFTEMPKYNVQSLTELEGYLL